MKISREEVNVFKPVTITLETLEELNKFLKDVTIGGADDFVVPNSVWGELKRIHLKESRD